LRHSICELNLRNNKGVVMVEILAVAIPLAAIGGGILAWLLTGSLGIGIVVFILLKLMGR
jgi:hypothetical protein